MQFHILSFEGRDDYARAGGIASRVTGLAQALAESSYETHLWFVGDPHLPGHEIHDQLQLHRWCQWIGRYYPEGVYDGEEDKRLDYASSLPPALYQEVLLSHLEQGGQAVILAEEWHTVDTVIHLDWLLRQGSLRHRVVILWNANNTYGFGRIDWGRLAQAAVITTVSRYMKYLMWNWGVNALVIPNGLSSDSFVPPPREAVAAFRKRLQGRTVISKLARWHPDKRWFHTIDLVGSMKRLGWRPLLIARGGVEAHGAEVLAMAATVGLRVVTRPIPEAGVGSLLEALEGMQAVDVASLTSPVAADSRGVLFHSSAAVLANSAHEPFGLVGLETMAVGGIACTGCSGEDYAVPGHNAIVLQTADPQEFIGLFGELRANPAREREMRRAGRATAKQYTWSRILQSILLPRLCLILGASCLEASNAPLSGGRERRMRIHIEGKHTPITPHLLGWIAERLEDLDTSHEEIIHARITLTKCPYWRRCRNEAHIELQLGKQILGVARSANTPYDALFAALKTVERKLDAQRALKGIGKSALESRVGKFAANC